MTTTLTVITLLALLVAALAIWHANQALEDAREWRHNADLAEDECVRLRVEVEDAERRARLRERARAPKPTPTIPPIEHRTTQGHLGTVSHRGMLDIDDGEPEPSALANAAALHESLTSDPAVHAALVTETGP